jgi:hypothetical protein
MSVLLTRYSPESRSSAQASASTPRLRSTFSRRLNSTSSLPDSRSTSNVASWKGSCRPSATSSTAFEPTSSGAPGADAGSPWKLHVLSPARLWGVRAVTHRPTSPETPYSPLKSTPEPA